MNATQNQPNNFQLLPKKVTLHKHLVAFFSNAMDCAPEAVVVLHDEARNICRIETPDVAFECPAKRVSAKCLEVLAAPEGVDFPEELVRRKEKTLAATKAYNERKEAEEAARKGYDINAKQPEAVIQPVRASVVVGTVVRVVEPVFNGKKFVGRREYTAEVTKESYGARKGQHTFSLRCLESWGLAPIQSGKAFRRKGRNVYGNLAEVVSQPEDLDQQNADKAKRRAEANLRKHINWHNEGKLDRVDYDLLARSGYAYLVAQTT